MPINTANGPIAAHALGRTLMHEHLVIGMPGWESDSKAPAPDFRSMVAACVDRIEELKSAGFGTILDPCPNDLGRNADLIGEVAAKTGFNIVFATGLYNEHHGGSPYWNMVFATDPDADKRLADLFVDEIRNGVRGAGIKPGVIKVGTSHPPSISLSRPTPTRCTSTPRWPTPAYISRSGLATATHTERSQASSSTTSRSSVSPMATAGRRSRPCNRPDCPSSAGASAGLRDRSSTARWSTPSLPAAST